MGGQKQERREKIHQIISVLGMYAFDEAAAEAYAVIRAQLERQGRVISERDTRIASIAIENDRSPFFRYVRPGGHHIC